MNDTDTSVTDTDLDEVTITRDFDAPRETVFRAFVEPEQFVRFWGPVGTHVPIESVVLEAWTGGRFEYTMVADDGSGEYAQRGTFVEVREPEVFAFREAGSDLVSTGTLSDLGDGRTRLVIHQTNVPAAYRTPEALAGFMTSLDRLESHLATV